MNSSTAVRSKRTAFPNLRLGSTGRLTLEACESTQRAETPSQSVTSCAVSSLSGRAEVFACGYAVVAAAGLKGERVAPMPFFMPLSQAQSKVFRLPEHFFWLVPEQWYRPCGRLTTVRLCSS